MRRRDVIASALAAPLIPVLAVAQDSQEPECHCVCMEERDGAFVIEGSGEKLSEPFAMEPGRYRLEVEIVAPDEDRDDFVGRFYLRATGDAVDSFSTSSRDVGFSTSIDLRDGNEFLFESVLVDSDWKLVISPI